MSSPLPSTVTLPADAVAMYDGHAVTTSLKIADIFGRNHKDVLRAIRDLSANAPQAFHERNFAPMSREVTVGNGATRPERYYNITRDGFVLLVMGFTGRQATAFKIAYIDRFNAMEQALHQPTPYTPDQSTLDRLAAFEVNTQANLTAAQRLLTTAKRTPRNAAREREQGQLIDRLQGENLRLFARLCAAHRLILRDPLLSDVAEWHPQGLSAEKLAKLHDTTADLITDLATQLQSAGLVLDEYTRARLGLARNALVFLGVQS